MTARKPSARPKAPPLGPEMRARILDLHAKRVTYYGIARNLGVTEGQVSWAVRKAGRQYCRVWWPEAKRLHVEEGLPPGKIAERLGKAERAVWHVLIKLDVYKPRGPGGHPIDPGRWDEAIRLHVQEGRNAQEIARLIGRSPYGVRRALKLAEVYRPFPPGVRPGRKPRSVRAQEGASP